MLCLYTFFSSFFTPFFSISAEQEADSQTAHDTTCTATEMLDVPKRYRRKP